MAKGSLFVGSGTGKVGNLVLANTKSGQVTRVYQPNVANPKTKGQMLQRAKFADAVKFFKQATEGFFKFAFEDKTKVESDYNAFMRHNIKNALPLSRELYDSPSVPALGDVFQMSQGRISVDAAASFVAKAAAVENGPAEDLTITLPAAAADATVGAVSQVLINAGLLAGDIVTIVRIGSALTVANVDDLTAFDDTVNPPKWTIYQFVLNAEDTTPLAAVPAKGYDVTDGVRALTISDDKKSLAAVFTTGASQWGALVITRNSDSVLYASTSYLVGDTVAGQILAKVTSDAAVANALSSWGSKGTAILKGSIAGA